MNPLSQSIEILPNHEEIVKKILRKYLPIRARVWVFGSRARKKQVKKYSDLDLAIDVAGDVLDAETRINLLEEFDESDLPFKVDIIDWNSVNNRFKNAIEQECILLDFK